LWLIGGAFVAQGGQELLTAASVIAVSLALFDLLTNADTDIPRLDPSSG
jgi:hypothetical protein